MAEAMRVALLARPGTACDKLQAALQQAGAEVVHIGDPTAGDAAALSAAAPGAVLVALEPAIEAALDGFDAILQDPARIVIYDEAELAAQREGWDSARWVRHLAAKLAGHSDVLPPGTAIEDARPAATAVAPAPAPAPVPAPTPGPEAAPEPALELEPALQPEPVPAPARDSAPASVEPPAVAETRGGTRSVTIEYSGEGLGDSMLSLVDDDAPAAPAAQAPEPAPEPLPEPVPVAEPGTMGGAVVLAGIGGPDAVRQFLGALPHRFPRPVLVRQRLDGGRHDRLVRQLQRATSLPVDLAMAGAPLAPGHVYILPDDMTTEASPTGPRFATSQAPAGALAGLPAADSAVLLLSGADPAQVDEVMDLAAAGALVAGQSPDECFDNAAPGAVIARGADSGSPAQLAERVASRWNP